MPKTPSIRLYELINSLSSSEKRYFNIFVATKATSKEFGKVNKYIQLFQLIETQSVYDEEAIKQAIYPNQTIESRKFSALKHYLYELILKSLQVYDEKTSVDFKLKSMLNNVRVLVKRSLYDHCDDILDKIKKLAYQYDNFIVVLEALKWKKQIAYSQSNIRFLNAELQTINEEESQLIHKITEFRNYQTLFFQFLIHLKRDALTRSEDNLAVLNDLIQRSALQKEQFPDFYAAQVLFYRIHGIYHSSTRSYDDYYQTNLALIQLMEQEANFLKEDPSVYISVITNQIFSCGMLRKYEEVSQNLTKLKSIQPITNDDKYKIFLHYYLNKMILCTENGAFKEGVQLIEERELESRQFPKAKSLFGINYCLVYSYLYFGAKRYDEALQWLNQLLDHSDNLQREDLQSVARILQIIIHYELGNTLFLEYLLRSTYRYLSKRNRLYAFEQRIIKFIKKSRNINTRNALQEEFIKLRADFQIMLDNPAESSILRYFDFISWLDSKIEGKSFEAVVQHKYQLKTIA
jgi:hypothetical protein